jgi:hypothetical protein
MYQAFFTIIASITLAGNVVLAQSSGHTITVDVEQQGKPFRPVWAHFGYDEPNYTYMRDGKKLLGELAALSAVPVYVRAHNLFMNHYRIDKDHSNSYELWKKMGSPQNVNDKQYRQLERAGPACVVTFT